MANNKSTYMQTNNLNWMKGATFPAAPATTYLALYTTMPTGQDGTGAVEVSGGAYARQAMTTSLFWSALSASGTAQTMSNAGVVNFPTATADWGTIQGVAIYSASSGGNLLWFGALTTPQIVLNTNTFSIAAGNLSLADD